jgi:hypothetical protein
MANGLPNILNPWVFLRFFAIASISVTIVQIATFGLDISFSKESTDRKKLELWGVGGVLYFLSGFVLKFPFSSPSTTKTLGSIRYKSYGQRKINAFCAVAKAMILSWLIIPFNLMTISGVNYLVAIGSTGMLSVLTVICFSLIPLSPSPGKEIFNYSKSLAVGGIVLAVCLLVVYYLGWLTFWGYLSVGLVASFILPIAFRKIEREKMITRQTNASLWFS